MGRLEQIRRVVRQIHLDNIWMRSLSAQRAVEFPETNKLIIDHERRGYVAKEPDESGNFDVVCEFEVTAVTDKTEEEVVSVSVEYELNYHLDEPETVSAEDLA